MAGPVGTDVRAARLAVDVGGDLLQQRPDQLVGLVGAPILIAVVFARLFGSAGSIAGGGGLAGIPVAAWELSLGLWLVVKGFRPSPITAEMDAAARPAARQDVAV